MIVIEMMQIVGFQNKDLLIRLSICIWIILPIWYRMKKIAKFKLTVINIYTKT